MGYGNFERRSGQLAKDEASLPPRYLYSPILSHCQERTQVVPGALHASLA